MLKGYKSGEDEAGVKVVLGEGEHGDSDVAEDEVLGQEVEEFEQTLGAFA